MRRNSLNPSHVKMHIFDHCSDHAGISTVQVLYRLKQPSGQKQHSGSISSLLPIFTSFNLFQSHYDAFLHHYYIIITSLLHIRNNIITSLLIYYLIITYYYGNNGCIITYYYLIITYYYALSHQYIIIITS